MSDFDARKYARFLGITPGVRDKHNYHLDPAFDGQYIQRLPDDTFVPAAEYAEKLKAYQAAQRANEPTADPQPRDQSTNRRTT